MSNEIGDLKIKVGVEVDAKKAIQENENAAQKTATIWERASDAIKRRNEAMATAAAAQLLDRGVAPFQVGDDPVAHLAAIKKREQDEQDAAKKSEKAAKDALDAHNKAADEIWKGYVDAAKKRKAAEDKAAADAKKQAEAAAKAHAEAAKKSAEKWKAAFGNAGRIVAGALAAGAAGIAVFARDLYQSGLAIDRQSRQLGMSAQEFQRWGYIAEQTGLEQQALVVSLAHLQQQAADAATQGGDAAKRFRDLGIAIEDSSGNVRSGSELMMDAADAIQRLGPGTEATAVAMRLFGEQGRGLLPVLLQGRQGVERLGGEFDALGGGLDDETIASIAEMDRTLNRTKQQLLALVMPIVRQAVPAMREFAGKIGGVIEKFKQTLNESHALRAGLITLGALLVGVGVAAAIAWAPIVVTLGVILAGAVALGLVVDDLITTFEGGDSVIRRFVDGLWGVGTTAKAVEDLKAAWDGLVAIFDGSSGPVGEAIASLTPLGFLFDTIKSNLDAIKRVLPDVISLLIRMNPLAGVIQGLGAIGRANGRRAPAATPAPAAAPALAPGAGVLLQGAAPVLSASPNAGGAGGSTQRVVNGNQRVNIQISGVLDAATQRAIGDVVNQAVADANQAAADDVATTGDET